MSVPTQDASSKGEIQHANKSEFEIMDALDEKQIVDELKGHVIEQFFWEFQQGGKTIVGISYAGIKHVCQKIANEGQPISIEQMEIDAGPETISALACAVNLKTGEKRWGAAEASRVITYQDWQTKQEKTKLNPFARPMAVSKAQRNAMRNFVPEVVIQEAYKEWKANKGQPALTAAEVQAREKAKAMASEGKIICTLCQTRFATWELHDKHRKEVHKE